MRCLKHRRAIIGNCQWCGNQLCQYCVSKQEGKKLYCEKCTIRLSGMKKVKMPPVQKIQMDEKKDIVKDRRVQQTQNKPIIDKDGYLILEQ